MAETKPAETPKPKAEDKPASAVATEEAKDVAKDAELVDLYNVNDGIHGRDGGPYLDQVEAAQHERFHAAREGKSPDYENPRPYPGIQLVQKPALIANYNPTLLAGDDRRIQGEVQAPVVTQGAFVLSPTDFSITDTEDRGGENDPYVPVLKDNPAENNFSHVAFED